MHWSDKYVGLPYKPDFDCAELARLVQREVFGREISLPSNRDYAEKHGWSRRRAMTQQIHREKDVYAVRTETPQDGDGVLLIARGSDSHIGVYCFLGEAYVLHASENCRQVIRTRVRCLHEQGLKLEGYYQWT